MDGIRRALRELPLPLRLAAVGAVVVGAAGGLVGLSIGVRSYVPTAWAAVFELAIPAALLGAVLGLVAGSVVWAYRHAHHD